MSNKMAIIYAVINQKGGVGKSTTAQALAAGLALRGKKVLSVDMDSQGNISLTMGAKAGESTFEVLMNDCTAKEAIQHTDAGDVIPASGQLSAADTVIAATGKEYRLREALEPVRAMYDYIIIDTPPALGILTVNSLTAAQRLVIPAQADIYSLQGVRQLYDTIDTVKKYCNPTLCVDGILLTRYNGRSILSQDLSKAAAATAEHFGTRLYKTPIRENIAVKEAQASNQTLFAYAPKSNAAKDYNAVLDEILEVK